MQFSVKRKRKMKAKTTETFMWYNMIILPILKNNNKKNLKKKKKKKKPNPLMHEATKLETNITFLLK